MIPNTTPTPNELYNGEMKKMSDTELRVVLVVTRSTLGWEIDHETGMRKKEDWLSSYQLIKKTGRSGRAISTAIDGCIKKGWIEARDKEGNILDTKIKRSGNKIYYRLGRIFLDKIKTTEESSEVKSQTSEKSSIEEFSIEKSSLYKRKTITKEKLNKTLSAKADGAEINTLIEKFKSINPSYERLYANITQRKALERLVEKYSFEKVGGMIDALPEIVTQKYAPQISTPVQLENKLGQLVIFVKQHREEKGFIQV